MAMPYPEGEVFFSRSTLRVPGGFDPSNFDNFLSHVLVEYVYNRPSYTRNNRAYPQYVEGSRGEKYYHPSSINFMFAKGSGDAPSRLLRVEPSSNATDYELSSKGGVDKVMIRPIKIKADERFMYMDLEAPLRAIYLPLAQKVDSKYPDLCTYLMLDLRYRKGAYMRGLGHQSFFGGGIKAPASGIRNETDNHDPLSDIGSDGESSGDAHGNSSELSGSPFSDTLSGNHTIRSVGGDTNGKRQAATAQTLSLPPPPITRDGKVFTWQTFNYKDGLGLRNDQTLKVDLIGAANYLVVPRQMREPTKGLFFPAKAADTLVFFENPDTSRLRWTVDSQSYESKVEYLDVIKDHFGVDVVYEPYTAPELAKSLVQQLAGAIGGAFLSLIPVVGPLVSVAWVFFVDAIYDPEGFKQRNFLKLDDGTLLSLIASAALIAENVVGAKGVRPAIGGGFGG